jgi:hypothetical protein
VFRAVGPGYLSMGIVRNFTQLPWTTPGIAGMHPNYLHGVGRNGTQALFARDQGGDVVGLPLVVM